MTPALRQGSIRAPRLPSSAIALVHRSDGSGTTYNFTYYLSDVSPDWKSKVGTNNTAVQWPAGIGRQGATRVWPTNVANTKGSIGYVEYAYAKQNKLTFTKMINKAGKPVAPTAEAFQAAAASRRLEEPAGLRRDPRQPAGRRLVADDCPRPGSCSTRRRQIRWRPARR